MPARPRSTLLPEFERESSNTLLAGSDGLTRHPNFFPYSLLNISITGGLAEECEKLCLNLFFLTKTKIIQIEFFLYLIWIIFIFI